MTSPIPSLDLIYGFAPVNMATADNTALRCKLDDCAYVVVVLFKAAGTASEDPTLTIVQADAATSGNTKAITFTKLYSKQATTLTATTAWSVVSQAAANTYTNATSAESQLIWAVVIKAEDLDRTNGYYWIGASVADVGNSSQIGGLFYIKTGLRLARE